MFPTNQYDYLDSSTFIKIVEICDVIRLIKPRPLQIQGPSGLTPSHLNYT